MNTILDGSHGSKPRFAGGAHAGTRLAGKSVLLVEDEEIVAEVISEVVAPCVRSFHTAPDGVEALANVMERDYDVILLDIAMPRMNGMVFYGHLRALKPYLMDRVIFITGDTETEAIREFIATSGCRFLDKPFMVRDLMGVMAGIDNRAA